MTWTQTILNIKDAAGTTQPVIAYTDGTNFSFAHPLLDNTGAIIAPATSGNQSTANTVLTAIQTAVTGATPAGSAIIGKVTTDQTAHGTTDLVAADITKVAGAAISQGHGTAATAIRVELSTDGTGVVGLAAGSAKVGVVTTDQTTHGTTDLVAADITKIAGSAISQGHGTASTAIRVELPTDGTGVVGLAAGTAKIGVVTTDQTTHGTTDLVAADITKVAGTAIATGHGTASGAIRVELPTDGTGVVGIAAGTNIVGKVGIDQTTPGTTNGVQVNAALPAGTNTIGNVTMPGSVHLTAAPTVTAGAYTTGMVVGGLLSLSSAARVNSGSGLIQSVNITVKTALTAPFDVLFFDTDPTNSTFTDNAALAINTADLPYLCGVAHCTDLISGGTPQVLQAANLALPFKLSAAATTLYAVIVIRGGETFASTSAIGISVLIKQD